MASFIAITNVQKVESVESKRMSFPSETEDDTSALIMLDYIVTIFITYNLLYLFGEFCYRTVCKLLENGLQLD